MSRSVNDLADALRFITNSMMIVTQSISIAFIFTAIMAIFAGPAQIIMISIALVYFFIVRFNRRQIVRNGKVISDKQTKC